VKFITRHLRRADLYTAQTPQGFRFRSILDAHEKAVETTLPAEYTDDAEVWGEFAGRVALVAGDPENRKITFPEDLRSGYTESGERKKVIGLGRDLHRLTPGRKFLLGGVEIPFDRGEQGHSDGDVLAHAVIDALLGAAGLGDIGELYSPDDPRWKDADSLELLKNAWTKVQNEGWSLVNLDCVVTCEKPKILPYRETIRRSLAQALGADPRSIFIKGKTNEGLGPLGAGEAVEAMAVCLLEKEGR
jgi:2-C-methyl-D-erythritol 4-phosphate cytidylyltransferase/2-C-methyl-D-erythritol 2,4-cyclodiphosphate synthase